nr:nascent polypeptide-associated complex subunit alpha, muscle-specific form-like [Loxodonta africana]
MVCHLPSWMAESHAFSQTIQAGSSQFLRPHLPAQTLPFLSVYPKTPQLVELPLNPVYDTPVCQLPHRFPLPFFRNTVRRGLGQVHSGGAFPGPVFPGSRWNFQQTCCPRHWTPPVPRRSPAPRCRADLSAPGTVPGNSSISPSPPRLQETETQPSLPSTPPSLPRGPAEPEADAGNWAPGADQNGGARLNPSPSPPCGCLFPHLQGGGRDVSARAEPCGLLRLDPPQATVARRLGTTRASRGEAASLTRVSPAAVNGGAPQRPSSALT